MLGFGPLSAFPLSTQPSANLASSSGSATGAATALATAILLLAGSAIGAAAGAASPTERIAGLAGGAATATATPTLQAAATATGAATTGATALQGMAGAGTATGAATAVASAQLLVSGQATGVGSAAASPTERIAGLASGAATASASARLLAGGSATGAATASATAGAPAVSLALHVDSTGGLRYRVRSNGSPSYLVDSTGGSRYRVVRGHEITSALEVSDPNVIPYDSLSASPLAIAVEDFSGSETIADFITAFKVRWPLHFAATEAGLSFATLNGRRVLKVPQGNKLVAAQDLPSLYPVLWSRSLIHIADTFAPLGGATDTGIATASMSDDMSANLDFKGNAEYQPDFNALGTSESYYVDDFESDNLVALPLSGIKGRVLSQVARLEVPLSVELGNLNVWIDGVKLFSGTLRYYGAFDGLKGLMCNFGNDLLAGGPSDPTNNYFYGILEEFVPGALGDSASGPYSGLEP